MTRADVAAAAGHALRVARAALPGLVGLVLVAFGCWLAWPPLGFIVPGALILLDRAVDELVDRRARAARIET